MSNKPNSTRRSDTDLAAVCSAVRQIMLAPTMSVSAWLDAVATSVSPFSPAQTAFVALVGSQQGGSQADGVLVEDLSLATRTDKSRFDAMLEACRRSLISETLDDLRVLCRQRERSEPLVIARADRCSRSAEQREPGHEPVDPEFGDWLRALVKLGPDQDAGVLAIDLRAQPPSWDPTRAERACAAQLALAAAEAYEHYLAGPRKRRIRLLEPLSPAQHALLPMLMSGLSEREIARRVGRSAHTIHSHARAICLAWGISCRAEIREAWNGAQAL